MNFKKTVSIKSLQNLFNVHSFLQSISSTKFSAIVNARCRIAIVISNIYTGKHTHRILLLQYTVNAKNNKRRSIIIVSNLDNIDVMQEKILNISVKWRAFIMAVLAQATNTCYYK